ncbi:MAG: class I SAM-dependent rRNA methyltransferase [Microthrixaceae bacterium]
MSSARRLATRVTRDAARQIRGGHPWVFDGAITSIAPDGRPGDLAVVFDERREFMAIGLFDPDSAIRVKVLHHGRPMAIDRDFWRSRVQAAVDAREAVIDTTHTTGWRCVHGENDGLPGLVLDRYDRTYVLKLYTAAWLPHLEDLLAVLDEVVDPERLVLRLGRTVQAGGRAAELRGPDGAPLADGVTLRGAAPERPVRFLEHDLRFEADVVRGQKTGFFLDQRDNRQRVRAIARGRRVLDVFCSTGGFSVNAAAGGATLVHSVDISAHAVDAARRNMALNQSRPAVRACTHHTSTGDAATVMAQMVEDGRRFDLVVVDPPSFAQRQRQVEAALHAYGRLTESALGLLEPGGTLVQASCSARVTAEEFLGAVTEAATRQGVRLEGVSHTAHAVDHPVGFAQGAYLKAISATVHPR